MRPTRMRTNFVLATATITAALTGWWVRGIDWRSAELPPIATPAAPSIVVDDAPSLHVNTMPRVIEAHPSRNLFAYHEAAVVQRVAYVAPPPVAIAAPPAVAIPVVVEAPPRLRFLSKFIGRFGPDRNPIAAFSRDGQITTVRVGERIDEHFVLRRIGIESVEVESGDGVQQVPLG
ncbi:MAG: hypothetical protein ACTHQM_20540 [Thermoanaerobaculia bacterium]